MEFEHKSQYDIDIYSVQNKPQPKLCINYILFDYYKIYITNYNITLL